MKVFSFILIVFLSISARAENLLLATENNLLVVTAGLYKGEPMMMLAQTDNSEKCRPQIQLRSLPEGQKPIEDGDDDVVRISFQIEPGLVCGESSGVKAPPNGDPKSGFAFYRLVDLVKNAGRIHPAVREVLVNHADGLAADKIEYIFYYETSIGGEPRRLSSFTLTLGDLGEQFQRVHLSDIGLAKRP